MVSKEVVHIRKPVVVAAVNTESIHMTRSCCNRIQELQNMNSNQVSTWNLIQREISRAADFIIFN